MISTGPANAAVAVIGIDNSFHVVFGVTDKIRATWLFRMELQRQWSSFLPNLRVAAPNPAETLSAGEEPAANYERQARQFSRDRLGRRSSRLDQCRFWTQVGHLPISKKCREGISSRVGLFSPCCCTR
jgi:hypothetical protein